MANLTCHSEVGEIESIVLKQASSAFLNQEVIDQQWEQLNYLGPVNFEKANEEYQKFDELIAASQPTVFYLPPSDEVTIDSIYCRDASIATDFGMILCNMGKAARRPEPNQARELYKSGVGVLGQIESPGTLEGGDVAWLDQKTLAVGHTYRTNRDGITQLRNLLEPHDINILVAEMPHYKGPEDVFHLMSVFSPVDEKKAVVYSPLMPIHFKNELLDRKYELIEVPPEEFDSMGTNVLAVGPGDCIMVVGNPVTKARLEKSGCQVREYKGEEISIKGGGGPTCLTRPLKRRV